MSCTLLCYTGLMGNEMLARSSWCTEDLNIGMLGSIAVRVAEKANASSRLQLVGCANHQTVVRCATTPLDDCRCDVKLYETSRALGEDCNRIPLLRDGLGIGVVQTQPRSGPGNTGVALAACGLSLRPVFFHQVHLHKAGDEGSHGDGMPGSLVRVGIVQIHLSGFNFGYWAGRGEVLKLHQGAFVGVIRVFGYQEVYQRVIVACWTCKCHIFYHLQPVQYTLSSVVSCYTLRDRHE